MALDLIDNIRRLEIPHLPGTKFKLRVGLHSGIYIICYCVLIFILRRDFDVRLYNITLIALFVETKVGHPDVQNPFVFIYLIVLLKYLFFLIL